MTFPWPSALKQSTFARSCRPPWKFAVLRSARPPSLPLSLSAALSSPFPISHWPSSSLVPSTRVFVQMTDFAVYWGSKRIFWSQGTFADGTSPSTFGESKGAAAGQKLQCWRYLTPPFPSCVHRRSLQNSGERKTDAPFCRLLYQNPCSPKRKGD